MIDLGINEAGVERNIRLCRDRGILLPTFSQMRDPENTPSRIVDRLKGVGLWDVDSLNLFRVNWQNEPTKQGGGFGEVNYIEFPPELTGVPARIVALTGKWFPTGAHKVGASYGCLAPALVTGQFDPESHKAVWPSTGNYCRGGAYISRLLACDSIAILPEEMSRERFEWLAEIAGETIATPGCESNVKEIFDKCWELKEKRGDELFIFNQFEQFGNHLWHHEVTGHAMKKLLDRLMDERSRFAGTCLSSGSAGTIGAGEYLKELFPHSKIAVAEALQCPTLLNNGFGGHKIEGIGDKHIPWIHNVRNTDMVIAVDDRHAMRLLRLFNEPAGLEYMASRGVSPDTLERLDLAGISGIGNLISAIKFSKYYELTRDDVVMTILTDSFEMYRSRLEELNSESGTYSRDDAIQDFGLLQLLPEDNLIELTYTEKKRIHNLKYYTWVEQQGKSVEELNEQWYCRDYWSRLYSLPKQIDRITEEFNRKVEEEQG